MEPRIGAASLVRLGAAGIAACLTGVLLGGCGVMKGTVTTILEPDMTLSRRVEVVAAGDLARRLSQENALGVSYSSVASAQTGFRKYWGNDGFHVEASALGAPIVDWCHSFTNEFAGRDYRWFVTYYSYSAQRTMNSFVPPHTDLSLGPEGPPTLTLIEHVTMPGRIIASTADKQSGSTASWTVGLQTLNQGYRVYARSRRVNRLETFFTVVLLAAVVALTALTIIHRRRRVDA